MSPPPKTAAAEGDVVARATEWFECVSSAFDSAARATGIVERGYALGGVNVLLRFAGSALVPAMTAAFEHLPKPATGARRDLIINLFDGATAGPLPHPPWGAAAYGARGEIRGYNAGPVRTVYEAYDQTFRMAHLDRQSGLFWVRDAASVPYYERGAPLRTVLHWLLGRFGLQLAHAAAVGDNVGAVLLTGRGGSGKSTSALTCVGSALRYLGDDYVLLESDANSTVVHSLYSAAKLHAEQLDRFPQLRSYIDNSAQLSTEKGLIFLGRELPGALATTLPLRAILLPRIVGGEATRVVPATSGAALAALAPTTVFQLPGDGKRSFDMLSTIARRTPCYWLELGTELRRIPAAIAEVLRS
jgi:hypothetical protein